MKRNFSTALKSLAVVAGMASVLGVSAPATAVEQIRAVHAFPSFLVYTKTFLEYVKKVNERGKGIVHINVLGGPEAIGMFQQPGAVRDGVVDMVHTPGSFYGAEVPEIDAMVAGKNNAVQVRKNGGIAVMDQAHQKRMNVKYLAWIDSGVKFHIYSVVKPKIGSDGLLDLTGVKLRDNPIYHAFFKELKATTASMKSTEVFGALEKGVVDAAAWTSIGLHQLKWDKFMKYRVDPAFYQTDLGIIVNLDKWNSLSADAKKVLSEVAQEVEASSIVAREADRKSEDAALRAGGMKVVTVRNGEKYIEMANSAAWDRMKSREEKMGDTSFYAKLRKLY